MHHSDYHLFIIINLHMSSLQELYRNMFYCILKFDVNNFTT